MSVFDEQSMTESYSEDVYRIGIWNSELALINKYASLGSRILILGCGAGRVPISLAQMGYQDITGLDLSVEMVTHAKANSSHLNITYFVSDFVHLDNLNRVYDIIFYPYNSLFHVVKTQHRIDALVSAKAKLAADGKIVFTSHIDRLKGEYSDFWVKNYNNEFEPGNLEINNRGQTFWMNFPTDDEVDHILFQSGLTLVDRIERNSFFKEKPIVTSYSNNCNFHICTC